MFVPNERERERLEENERTVHPRVRTGMRSCFRSVQPSSGVVSSGVDESSAKSSNEPLL